MNLVFSRHARQRMRQRNITESDVREALGNITQSVVKAESTSYLGDVRGRTLKVVVRTSQDADVETFVITTVWRGDDDR